MFFCFRLLPNVQHSSNQTIESLIEFDGRRVGGVSYVRPQASWPVRGLVVIPQAAAPWMPLVKLGVPLVRQQHCLGRHQSLSSRIARLFNHRERACE